MSLLISFPICHEMLSIFTVLNLPLWKMKCILQFALAQTVLKLANNYTASTFLRQVHHFVFLVKHLQKYEWVWLQWVLRLALSAYPPPTPIRPIRFSHRLKLLINLSFCLRVSGHLRSSSQLCSSRQGRVRAKGSCGPHGDFIMAYFQRNETAANKDLHKDKQPNRLCWSSSRWQFWKWWYHTHCCARVEMETEKYLLHYNVCACAISLFVWDPRLHH